MQTLLILAVVVGAMAVLFGQSWLGYGVIAVSLIIRVVTMPERELEAAVMGILAILFIGIPVCEWLAAKRKRDSLKD